MFVTEGNARDALEGGGGGSHNTQGPQRTSEQKLEPIVLASSEGVSESIKTYKKRKRKDLTSSERESDSIKARTRWCKLPGAEYQIAAPKHLLAATCGRPTSIEQQSSNTN